MDKKTDADFFSALLTNKETRNAFKKNPKSCLKENGVSWEDKREIKVVEDTAQKKYFIIRTAADLDKAINQTSFSENYRNFLKELKSEAFKARLKKDPKAVLQTFQMELGNSQIEILEDTDQVIHITLPHSSEIDESLLANIVGGAPVRPSIMTMVLAVVCAPLAFASYYLLDRESARLDREEARKKG